MMALVSHMIVVKLRQSALCWDSDSDGPPEAPVTGWQRQERPVRRLFWMSE